MDIIKNKTYHDFLKEIKERIYKAQYDALEAVNRELINLETYAENQKLAPLVREIGWSHCIAVFLLTNGIRLL